MINNVIDENEKYGIALSDKTISIECKYDDIKQITANNVYVVKVDGKWQIINEDKNRRNIVTSRCFYLRNF